jgi:hypothetical protein
MRDEGGIIEGGGRPIMSAAAWDRDTCSKFFEMR